MTASSGNLAASRTNGRASRRMAALKMMQSRRFWCCERTQREMAMAALGSLPSNASPASSPAKASQDRLFVMAVKLLILQHLIRRAAILVSATVIRAKSGETLKVSPQLN
ncbi:hypothetical protein [Ruegeria sp. MALMAid1280]|uniref:hypothetical protein n=1 Tax=Ruegeria sp. MALMAid1280 TaxID=3411634 RepID=UPI003B9F43C1